MKRRLEVAFEEIFSMCFDQFKFGVIVTPKYFAAVADTSSVLCNLYQGLPLPCYS